MKNSAILVVTLVAVAFGFQSCKKDNPTFKETILEGKWKLTGLTLNTLDIYATMEACEKDNTIDFQTGGVAVNDEGATKCDPAAPQTSNDTYSISADEKTITLGSGVDAEVYTVTSFSDSKVVLTNIEVDGTDTYTTVVTIQKV